MADSAVVVTSGTGTNIDTRTEATNGHHRQVVVLGDPATNAGVAPVDATAGLKVDLGADNDITGTVTANLSATDNAVLDAIESDTTAILADTTTIAGDTTSIDGKIPALGQALAAASVPVVLTAAQLTTLTPPAAITGFATETTLGLVNAKLVSGTDIGDVTINNTTSNAVPVQPPLSGYLNVSIDQTGNNNAVDVLTIAAGNNNIGDVDVASIAAGSAIIGKVGIDQTTPGTTNKVSLGSDVVHTIVDSGSTVVTQGTATNLKTQAETYQGGVAVSSAAPLQVTLANGTVPSHAVTNAGTFAVQSTNQANSGIDIGDVTINNASGASAVNIQDGGNSITVDGSVTTSGTVTATLAAETTKVIGTVNQGTSPWVTSNATTSVVGNGAAATAQRVTLANDSTGILATVTALTGSGIAHDGVDSGNPHKFGFKAYSPDGTTPGTAVAEADRTDAKGNLDGQLFVQTEHPRWGSYHVDGSTALTDATVAASPGAGFQTVITNISFSSGAATAINMFLEEGSTKIFGPIYLEAVAGRGFCTPAGFRKHVTASTAVTITTSAAIAHSVDIQYETIAV